MDMEAHKYPIAVRDLGFATYMAANARKMTQAVMNIRIIIVLMQSDPSRLFYSLCIGFP